VQFPLRPGDGGDDYGVGRITSPGPGDELVTRQPQTYLFDFTKIIPKYRLSKPKPL
jgi:hypothetical protein